MRTTPFRVFVLPMHRSTPRRAARAIFALWLLALPLAGLATVVTSPMAQASWLPDINLTLSHGLVNQSQVHPLWSDMPVGPSGNYVMGGCGCLLSALSTVVTYHLGDGSQNSGGSVPWFQVEHHTLEIDPTDPQYPHRRFTRIGQPVLMQSFSPVYIDQYLQRGNMRDPYPLNWGYKSGFVDACGGYVRTDALESLAIPQGVYDESGNLLTSTPSGVRLQWHAGFGADVRDIIDRNLMTARPTIVGLKNEVSREAHAYVIVGWDADASKYLVVDPADPLYTPAHVPEAAPPGSSERSYEGWEKMVEGIFDAWPVHHNGSSPLVLQIADDPAPFELLSINPDGLRSGYDPTTGLILSEDGAVNYYPMPLASDLLGQIPPAPEERMMSVREPRPGTYRFAAIATGDGELILNFRTAAGYRITDVGRIEQPITNGQIVKIEATSTGSAIESVTQVDNFTPEARAGSDVGGAVGDEIVFDASRSFDLDGTIVSYAWDFGDGTTGIDVRPSHAYATAGVYTVTLTVTDDRGATDMATTRAVVGRDAPEQTAMISVSSTGEPGLTQGSFRPSISADGRYVAFDSGAWNLTGGDTNSRNDIFVRDHQSGVTTRVSVSTAGAQASDGSFDAAISADGRFVAFTSNASNLVAGDTNARGDVFIHDRQGGTTERVSVASDGAQANDASGSPSISADGRYVAFQSQASNLVAGDTNAAMDIFVRDRVTGTTERVSLDAAGNEGIRDNPNAAPTSTLPAISADGRLVVFESWARLVPDDTNGRADVYLRDRVAGTTERLSVAGGTIEEGGTRPAISGDGSVVAYVAETPDVVVVRDLRDGSAEVVGPDGAPLHPNQGDGLAVSNDGRFVAFAARGNVLPDDTYIEAAHVYVRDRQTGDLERVSVSDSGEVMTSSQIQFVGPAISADGRYVAFGQGTADPRYRDTSLTPDDANNQYDVFIRDRHEPEPTRPVAVPGGPYIAWATGEAVPTSVTLDASGSLAFNGSPLRARWDFGDGSQPVEVDGLTIGHSYAEPGVYTMTMTVLDDLAESEPMTTTVEVLPALPEQNRLDATPSCVEPGGTIEISGYSAASGFGTHDGAAVDDLIRNGWNLAAGPLEVEPAELFLPWSDEPLLVERRLPDLLFRVTVQVPAGLEPGAYEIGEASSGGTSILVPCPPVTNHAPTADAGGPEYIATTGVPVALDGSGSSDPEGAALTYHWDFGDGVDEEVDTPQVSHVFGYPGVYIVSLTVNDGQTDSPRGPGTRGYAIVTVTGESPSDTTPPTAAASVSPVPIGAGWHAGAVTVEINATDEPGGSGVREIVIEKSGVESDSSVVAGAVASVQVTAEGDTTVTYRARDNAGNESVPALLVVRIDRTAPTVGFDGNAGTYGIADRVTISCVASDDLSGLATDTCADVDAPATSFGPGSHTLSASATDNAGNIGSGSTTFEVQVSFVDLCTLTRSYVNAARLVPAMSNRLGASLCAQLNAAQAAAERGNDRAKDGALKAYVSQVRAQTPAVFTAEQRDLLIELADAL